ncbi:hypothetical protein HKD37_18G049783 [Glycine soja]
MGSRNGSGYEAEMVSIFSHIESPDRSLHDHIIEALGKLTVEQGIPYYVEYFTDQVIRKAPSDFRQRFSPSPATLEQKNVKFTGLTSTVDAQTSVALHGSFLAPPPHHLNEEEEEPQRRRRKKNQQEEEEM